MKHKKKPNEKYRLVFISIVMLLFKFIYALEMHTSKKLLSLQNENNIIIGIFR